MSASGHKRHLPRKTTCPLYPRKQTFVDAWARQDRGHPPRPTEVSFIFDRQDPHSLCVHEVFFKAQSEDEPQLF
jgi:hypothetical protein